MTTKKKQVDISIIKALLTIFSFWLVYMFYTLLAIPFLVSFSGEKTVLQKVTIILIQTPINMVDPNSEWFFHVWAINRLCWAITLYLCTLVYRRVRLHFPTNH